MNIHDLIEVVLEYEVFECLKGIFFAVAWSMVGVAGFACAVGVLMGTP